MMELKTYYPVSSKFYKLLFTFILILICSHYNILIGYELPLISANLTEINRESLIKQDSQYNSTYTKPILMQDCVELKIQETNITTVKEYVNFDFQDKPDWLLSTDYWEKTLETRFQKQIRDPQNHPLKVIILLHSHNDPGWLHTFSDYFNLKTKHILNSVISQMTKYEDMTFIWSEICFLQLWWDQAQPTERSNLKKLVNSGRFEIMTGGWVMSDEANVHLYAMIDQLIEGHQWTQTHLNTKPTVGWSIDPFGHGATIPYLLAASDFDGTIIQRIHYAWKHWFAEHQNGDFIWEPTWKISDKIKRNLLTHNMPFDIYTTDRSCGPYHKICSKFEFYKNKEINDTNIAEKAQLLMKQYSRAGSLFSHNVALILVGGDFRYSTVSEIKNQYLHYKRLIDYINTHKGYFNADISFGTPKDYFLEIKKRTEEFPTLKGDFFVYSDIFSDGSPGYWSGYFSTRPNYKILSNKLEHNLRSIEILFTFAYNIARKNPNLIKLFLFKKMYTQIILARRNLGLFQHHDGITGTSTYSVMRNYFFKLFTSIVDTIVIQTLAIEMLLQNTTNYSKFLQNELEYEPSFGLFRKKILYFKDVDSYVKLCIVFNSLAQTHTEIISIQTTTPNVMIVNEKGLPVQQQIIPISYIENYKNSKNKIINKYEILFLAELPPLSLLTFQVISAENKFSKNLAKLYCNDCLLINSTLQIKKRPPGDIRMQNNKLRLLFSERSGFLKSVFRKDVGQLMDCAINFAGYTTTESGVYLFKTNHDGNNNQINILTKFEKKILIISGPLFTEIIVVYGLFLAHSIRILHTRTHLDTAIYMQNEINFNELPQNWEITELFMRLTTDIKNGPVLYTDQNGFQFQHRVNVPSIGIEGNYFPITTAAFIQDKINRLTLLTTHAQGAASLKSGELEVILDRRTSSEDGRGMRDPLLDNVLTQQNFLIIIEDIKYERTNNYQVLSLLANHLSNSLKYPPNVYFIDKNEDRNISKNLKMKVNMIKHEFPCDLHLLNIRTLTNKKGLSSSPSRSALLLLHRQGIDCNIGDKNLTFCNNVISTPDISFNGIEIESIQSTSLTGLNNIETIKDFSNISIEPMDVRTFNFTFQ